MLQRPPPRWSELRTEAPTPRQPPEPARVRLGTVLLSMAGLWAVYFLLVTVRSALGLDFQGELLVRRLMVAVIGFATTVLVWLVLARFDARPLWIKATAALVIAAPAALLVAQANRIAFADLQERMIAELVERQGGAIRRDAAGDFVVEIPPAIVPEQGIAPGYGSGAPSAIGPGIERSVAGRLVLPNRSRDRWRSLIDSAVGYYFQLLAWAALYFSLVAAGQARVAERREGEFRRAAKAAELLSLRYQVNPHFLFNSFNSLSALVMTGRHEEAERMIETISRFYRRSLAEDPTADVPLADEFAGQRLYLDIEQIRFPERLATAYDLPDGLEDALVPGLILQPLVENSVRYAVAPSAGRVTVTIAAGQADGQLVLTVEDRAAPGAAPAGPGAAGHGIGIANVRQRLAARFGAEASLVSAPHGAGWRTVIRMPLVRA